MIVPLATIAINGTGCRPPENRRSGIAIRCVRSNIAIVKTVKTFGGGMISARVHMG